MGHPTILVIDDEPEVLALVSRMLTARDYEVVSMGCPLQALEFVCNTPSFDLVVSDVIMPGLCGPELVRRILEVWPNAGVILMSGYLSREELPTYVGFLTKPFALRDLFASVERALASRGQRPETRYAGSASS